MRWHNGRTRRSPNPNSAEVLRDCVTNGERSAAHSILARSHSSNKGRIHLRRPNCHSHFSLATRRRTIHDEWPTTRSKLLYAKVRRARGEKAVGLNCGKVVIATSPHLIRRGQRGNEGIYLAQNIDLIGLENVVGGVRNSDDTGRRNLPGEDWVL
jgi:hypothetical protein